MVHEKVSALIDSTSESIKDHTFIKLIFHKPVQSKFTKSILTAFLNESNEICLKVSNFTKTQDFTETHNVNELNQIITEHLTYYSFADLFTTRYELLFKNSKKNIPSLMKKVKEKPPTESALNNDHNKQKNYLIPAISGFLYDLDITDQHHTVKPSMYHKYRQINKFIEIINHHVRLKKENPVIADMGCGKGYLTFALQHYMVQNLHLKPKITGVDLRQDLIEFCNKTATNHDLSDIHFITSDIGEINFDDLDLMIALHACDIATDLAIEKGIKAGASYIILSPCCHKQIRKEMKIKNEITQYGIFEERMAEMITDTIRTLILNHFGYKTKILEYISSEHTSKNTMIIAEKNNTPDKSALAKIKEMKNQFGISQHFLEHLLHLS